MPRIMREKITTKTKSPYKILDPKTGYYRPVSKMEYDEEQTQTESGQNSSQTQIDLDTVRQD